MKHSDIYWSTSRTLPKLIRRKKLRYLAISIHRVTLYSKWTAFPQQCMKDIFTMHLKGPHINSHECLQGPELLFMLMLYDSVCLVILHIFISFVFLLAKCLQPDQCHLSLGTSATLLNKGRVEFNSKEFFLFFVPEGENVEEIWVILGITGWNTSGCIHRWTMVLVMCLCPKSTAHLCAFIELVFSDTYMINIIYI